MVFQCLGHVSGAHVNPAVTVGLLSAGHVFLLRAVMYIAAQCAGAIAAAVVLKALTPEESESTLGVTAVSPHLTLTQAVFVEAFITFFLVMTVFGARSARGSAGFAIGLSITTCHLFAMQYTGASMNPARSLGPAMVTGVWHNHWVYWMGPLAGGIAAGAMSSCLFRPSVPKAPVRPTRDSEHRDNPTKEMEELTGQLHQKVIKTKDRKKNLEDKIDALEFKTNSLIYIISIKVVDLERIVTSDVDALKIVGDVAIHGHFKMYDDVVVDDDDDDDDDDVLEIICEK
ncbi:aquaporin AQPAe.a-like [Schistocerca serialis cubense]|uniref:aquaporin AQPAe.a-like n=1 Tax=Schistocerca serialis cubense TaxID=2023355 RepID=UPI00214E8685|nr:aquaporin AQPAe.a-like [Schistocerca serialis cubense]